MTLKTILINIVLTIGIALLMVGTFAATVSTLNLVF